MRPASVSPAARRPPPRGKVLGQWNWVDAVENTRGRRGHAPALRTVYVPFSKRLSVNESGDPQRWWFTIRVTVSNRQRRHAALASPFGRGAQCAHWAERVFFTDHNIITLLPSQSASPPALPEGEPREGAFCFGASVSLGFAVPHPSRLRRAAFPLGKVLGRWNWVDAVENTRGRRGHAPALRKVRSLCPKD